MKEVAKRLAERCEDAETRIAIAIEVIEDLLGWVAHRYEVAKNEDPAESVQVYASACLVLEGGLNKTRDVLQGIVLATGPRKPGGRAAG